MRRPVASSSGDRRGTPDGYEELVAFAEERGGFRAWAIEGTGSYGAGPTPICTRETNSSLSSIGRNARAVTAPSPTRSMPSGQHEKQLHD